MAGGAQKRYRLIGLVLPGIIIGVFGFMWIYEWGVNQDYDALHRQARREGLTTTLEEFRDRQPKAQPDQNAIHVYERAGGFGDTNSHNASLLSSAFKQNGVIDVSMLREYVASLEPYLKVADEAAHFPLLNLNADPRSPNSHVIDICRHLVAALVSRSNLLVLEGRRLEGLEELRKAAVISRHARAVPGVLGVLIEGATEAVLMDGYRVALRYGPMTEAEKGKAASLLSALGSVPSPIESQGCEAFERETALLTDLYGTGGADSASAIYASYDSPQGKTLRMLMKNHVFRKSVVCDIWRAEIRVHQAMVSAGGDYVAMAARSQSETKAILTKFGGDWNLKGKAVSAYVFYQPSLIPTVQAAVVNRDLIRMSIGQTARVDPFTNRPYRVVDSGRGTLIYSLGTNGVDDGGVNLGEYGSRVQSCDMGVEVLRATRPYRVKSGG